MDYESFFGLLLGIIVRKDPEAQIVQSFQAIYDRGSWMAQVNYSQSDATTIVSASPSLTLLGITNAIDRRVSGESLFA